MAEDTTYLHHQIWSNLGGAQLKASPMLTSVHSDGKKNTRY